MEESGDDDWSSSDFIINKAIPARENNAEETLILQQKRFLIFLPRVLQTNNSIADSKLNAGLALPIFGYSGEHCILIKSGRAVRLCVNINQCISLSSALSGSPGLWLINELFSTLSPLLLTTYHQPPPHNINQTLSSSPPLLTTRESWTPFLLF